MLDTIGASTTSLDDAEGNAASVYEGWPDEGLKLVTVPRKHAPGLNSLLRWAFERGASRIAFSTAKPVTIRVHGRNITVTRATVDDADISLVTNHLYGADGTARLQNCSDFDVAYEIPIDRTTRLRFRPERHTDPHQPLLRRQHRASPHRRHAGLARRPVG